MKIEIGCSPYTNCLHHTKSLENGNQARNIEIDDAPVCKWLLADTILLQWYVQHFSFEVVWMSLNLAQWIFFLCTESEISYVWATVNAVNWMCHRQNQFFDIANCRFGRFLPQSQELFVYSLHAQSSKKGRIDFAIIIPFLFLPKRSISRMTCGSLWWMKMCELHNNCQSKSQSKSPMAQSFSAKFISTIFMCGFMGLGNIECECVYCIYTMDETEWAKVIDSTS